ncbi:MAG TPA: hypothetical protein VN088_07230 [Nocardioides sp.]|nr:hypothetical protein [Nocardioides sp.]
MNTDRSWVTQCALSRICGECGRPLGRPIAFLGTPDEIGRNAFHAPPLHADCAEAVLRGEEADPAWRVTHTAGFEFVRPSAADTDRRPCFVPNSLLR